MTVATSLRNASRMTEATDAPPSTPLSALRRELARISPALWKRLKAAGFDEARLLSLAATLEGGASGEAAGRRRDLRNRVRGQVLPPLDDEAMRMPRRGDPQYERLEQLGRDALARGEVALCVMAGGMATRMGGCVKALVDVLEGHTFLDLRLRANANWTKSLGRPVPLWLMTSDATDAPIREALRARKAPPHIKTFTQDLSLRLTPEGRLFYGDDGEPSTYAPGHGDLVDAIRRSGLLSEFRKSGGKYVWIANLDNLGATVDPALLGAFIDATVEKDAELLVEVVDKVAGDRGGIPVHLDGRMQVLEEFRLPVGFDASQVRVFNTNTFLVDARALETARIGWNWFEVEKNVDGRTALQFERLLQELTTALRSMYVRVPREGEESRFLPVKDFDELARRRSDIERVARARGML